MRCLAFASLIGIIVAQLTGAAAQAQTCYTLQAELDHLESQGEGGARDRMRYERAWQEQANVMARAQAQAEDANCFGGAGFLFFRTRPAPVCDILIPKLRRMQENLAKLDRLRLLGGRDNAARIRNIRRSIAARRCGDETAEGQDNAGQDNAGQDSEGQGEIGRENAAPTRASNYDGAGEAEGGGTYHTMCVRSCDGYYFPISFSTTPDKFADDAQSCSAMCPGAESKLFTYSNPGGGPQDMVSLDGEPYASLSTAFQYRTKLDQACTCRSADNMSPIPAEGQSGSALERSAVLARTPGAPRPVPRPAPGEDPETLADRDGAFTPHGAAPAGGPAASATSTTGPKPVRVVGPAYWGAPAPAGVVLTPVPN